jgi:predicted flap endonuclease-1-like 5' DNA nuclease
MVNSADQVEKNVSASFGYVKKDMLMLNDALSDVHDKIQHLSMNNAALLDEIRKLSEMVNKLNVKKAPAKKAKVVKKVVKKKPSKDDLTKVEGVGPAIKKLLWKNKIETFKDLAKTPVQELRDILDTKGPMFQMHNPSTWARQAKLAQKKKWVELERYQAKLDGGISKKATNNKSVPKTKTVVKKTIETPVKGEVKKVVKTEEIVYS